MHKNIFSLLILIGFIQTFSAKLNVVLVMSDDQGWGDIGYNDHTTLKTPVLDEMASTGIRFNRFYSGHSNCSPTRSSFLTGRNPNRMGTFHWGFSIRPGELTLPEVLQQSGYATAHFGKWHVGPVKAGTPLNPGNNGYDTWLAHDNFFDMNPEFSLNGEAAQRYTGESSEILVGEALKYIDTIRTGSKPFLTVIWFGSPHSPHAALQADKDLYSTLSAAQQNYQGEITAMDRAIGTLRQGLKNWGLDSNTILWFCSDNGPEAVGRTAGLRGKKHDLWEGGIRVPAVIEWPGYINAMETEVPASTIDIMPTILDLIGIKVDSLILDGISLKPLMEGTMTQRPKGLPFWLYPRGGETSNGNMFTTDETSGWWRNFSNYLHPVAQTSNFTGHAAWIEGKWKLHKINGSFELYDLETDPAEANNIASSNAALVTSMSTKLEDWQRSVEISLTGADYLTPHPIHVTVKLHRQFSSQKLEKNGTRDAQGKSLIRDNNSRPPAVILFDY